MTRKLQADVAFGWNDGAQALDPARWLELFGTIHGLCESPIERALGHAMAVLWEQSTGLATIVGTGVDVSRDSFRHQPRGLNIWPQCKVGPYRTDFFMILNGSDGWGAEIVVECDGHQFHEKTKEQAKRDKRRDRELNMAGVRVLRFTGSEINADPYGSAREALYILRSSYAKRGD